MPKFLLLYTFKGETLQGFMKRPNDRSQVVGAAAESVGGSLDSYYWMLGANHDGLAILDLPDSNAAARIALTISGSGAFLDVQIQELFSAQEVMEMARNSGGVRYAAPGESAEYLSHPMP
ncbi:MAG: GYD domain-containing protein [Actinomycetota bacterium]|jgi:uncharacterized protein with GYD domain|nr:GYD domain-containing protein [Actinomycetota bacterium]